MKPRILIVDQSRTSAFLMLATLNDAFDVRIARDSAAGGRKAVSEPPDLILLDLEMPGGIQLLKDLRLWGRTRQIPVVMISSLAGKKWLNGGPKTGNAANLARPIVPHQLRTTVERILCSPPQLAEAV